MATQIYKVRDPSGAIREIEGPSGATDAQVIAKAKELFAAPKAPADAERSMYETVMGNIETIPAMGSAAVSGVVAPIAGVFGTLTSGKYGTQEGIRAGENVARNVQEYMTYQPRTPEAQRNLQTVGEVFSNLVGVAPTNMLQSAGILSQPITNQLAAKTATVTQPMQNAMAGAFQRKPAAPMPGMGAAETSAAALRQERLNRFGIRSTTGEREQNLAKQQFESEVERGSLVGISDEAKAELAKQYGAFKSGQKSDILNEFENMTEQVGGTIDRTTPRAVGNVVDKALVNQYKDKLKKVDEAYQKARDAGETKQVVDTTKLEEWLTDNAPEAISVPQIQTIEAKLKALKKVKNNQVTIDDLENLYKSAGNLAEGNPSASLFMGKVKGVINDMTEGTGGDLYRAARSERKQLAKQFEDVSRVDNLLSTKAGRTDRKVALDDVYNHVVIDGSLEEMRTVTSLLKKTEEGKQAYKELQGYTLQRMKDLLLKKGGENDKIMLNNFNNFVTQLDREDKLAYMFGKSGRDQIVDLQQSIKDVMIKEPGAVNYPNTGGLVLRGLEKLLKLPVKVPGAKTAAEWARERQYAKQLQESLTQPNQLAPTGSPQNALAP